MRLRSLFLCALLSVPLAAIACSSSSGSSGPSDAGACGGFGSPMAACNTCLTSSCCMNGDVCHANSECQALFDCIKGCSDSPCETNCESAHPMGFNDLDSLFNCVNTSCPVQCGVTSPDASTLPADGGDCGGYSSADATCNACFMANCCQQGAVCAANAACNNLLFCIKLCNDQTCVDNCNTMYASGQTDFNAFNNCLSGNCNTQCAGTPQDAGPSMDAGMCGGYGSANNPACDTCLKTSCCTQAAACGASTDCNNLFACVQKCPQDPDAGPPCQNACATQYPNGIAAYNPFISCMNTNCNAACSGVPNGG